MLFTENKTVKLQNTKRNIQGRINLKTLVPFFGCIFVALLFIAWTRGGILSSSNMEIIFNQVFTTIMIGSGAVFVYAYGGIDFSLGSILGLGSFIITLMTRTGYSVLLAILVSVLIAVVCQAIIGYCAATLKIPLIIMSLSFNYIIVGILRAGISSISTTLYIPPEISSAWSDWWVRAVGLIIVVGVMWFIFAKTRFGKYSKLIGGNEMAVRLCGINVKRQKVLSHVFLGICLGIASIFSVTRAGCVTPSSGGGVALLVMEALILGGIPINGGKDAKMISVILGALIIAILKNGLLLVGVNQFAIEGITGVLFIIVIALTYKRIKGIIII